MKEIEVTEASIEGNNIRKMLKGVSQEELSRRAGVSSRQLNRVILGQSEPKILMAIRLATVLGVPVEDIFTMNIKTRKR